MKTLVVLGRAPLPAGAREVVERGSTSIVERSVAELRHSLPNDVDRIVLWAAPDDREVAELARAYSRGASPERKDTLVVISPDGSSIPGMQPSEVFAWPGDEDRLKLAFMTGG